MKQIVLALLIILSLKTFAYERKTDTTLHIGLKAGICNSKLRNFDPYLADYGNRFSYTVNIFAEYQPTREFGLSGGFDFSNKGFTSIRTFSNSVGETFDTISNISLNYFKIPISLNYHFGRRFNPYIGVGASFGFLLSARQYADLPEFYKNSAVLPFDQNVKDTYRNFELCVHALGGIEYRVKPNISIFAEAKFEYGITKVFSGPEIVTGNRIKNNSLLITIGIKIGIPIKLIVYEPSY
jgi:opacity protein-like surface antigen